MMPQDENLKHGADDLDHLLKAWHTENRERAMAGRDRLLSTLASTDFARPRPQSVSPTPSARRRSLAPGLRRIRSFASGVWMRVGACTAVFAILVAFLLPNGSSSASACDVIQAAEGGRLDAMNARGELVGPCPLKHTAVDVHVAGPFTRVNVRQVFENTYAAKVEAVYTFPLSHRAAVDRMTMTVHGPDGDRVIVGEMKERNEARRIYESARESGYVASLLEQERPNIFTQSVANIEPGATVTVDIGYVETLQAVDGEYRFDFPMVVEPRYIPGSTSSSLASLPPGLTVRYGVVLLGPATYQIAGANDNTVPIGVGQLASALSRATAIEPPRNEYWASRDLQGPSVLATFAARYGSGAVENGQLYQDGSGQINGRWFYVDLGRSGGLDRSGGGSAADTDQVPDASRITPTPVKPPMRAGHDISLNISIDTGSPDVLVTGINSVNHQIATDGRPGVDQSEVRYRLANAAEIPNRDFVLTWRTKGDGIQEGVFAYPRANQEIQRNITGTLEDSTTGTDGFFTLFLKPPDRVEDDQVRPRELIFVVDTSGSMSGFPIEKSKDVMARALGAVRPGDTFNVITFAGATHILWSDPRPATPENLNAARAFVANQSGNGGTEMMEAIRAALVQRAGSIPVLTPKALADLPADGRNIELRVTSDSIEPVPGAAYSLIRIAPNLAIKADISVALPQANPGTAFRFSGTWQTRQGDRVLMVSKATFEPKEQFAPTRICMFLTDGMVGNDQEIIQAVRDNALTTRVFSFGIGNSVNRFLLEQMALAGRGAVEFVQLESDADAAVERFSRRIKSPVLTDIDVKFSENLHVSELVSGNGPTPAGLLPDLFDESPLVLHGRYTSTGRGTVTVSGRTGAGPWARTLDIDLSAPTPNDMLPALWARAEVDRVLAPHMAEVEQQSLAPDVRAEIINLGVNYSIMTPYTSFVAVERGRVTVGGRPVLVQVPIELPEGTRWEGFFGGECWQSIQQRLADKAIELKSIVSGGAYSIEPSDHSVNTFQLGETLIRTAGVNGVSENSAWYFDPQTSSRFVDAGLNVNLARSRDSLSDRLSATVPVLSAIPVTGGFIEHAPESDRDQALNLRAAGEKLPPAGAPAEPSPVADPTRMPAGDERKVLPAENRKEEHSDAVSAQPQPSLPAPASDVDEGEPCGEDTNGGSNEVAANPAPATTSRGRIEFAPRSAGRELTPADSGEMSKSVNGRGANTPVQAAPSSPPPPKPASPAGESFRVTNSSMAFGLVEPAAAESRDDKKTKAGSTGDGTISFPWLASGRADASGPAGGIGAPSAESVKKATLGGSGGGGGGGLGGGEIHFVTTNSSTLSLRGAADKPGAVSGRVEEVDGNRQLQDDRETVDRERIVDRYEAPGADASHLLFDAGFGVLSDPLVRSLLGISPESEGEIQLLPENVVLAVIALDDLGPPRLAIALAQQLCAWQPADALAAKLANVIADPGKDSVHRGVQLSQLRAEAEARLAFRFEIAEQQAALKQSRQSTLDTLRRRLDDRLLSILIVSDVGIAVDPTNVFDGVDTNSAGVLVSIGLDSLSPQIIDRIQSEGATVIDQSPVVKVVVARIPVHKLATVALVEGVRRIEPAQLLAAR